MYVMPTSNMPVIRICKHYAGIVPVHWMNYGQYSNKALSAWSLQD